MRLREIDVDEFVVSDLDEMDIRIFDTEWIKQTDLIKGYAKLGNMGPACTGRYEGKVIFCAGIRVLWKGVGEVWSIGDKILAKKFAKEMFEWQKELINTVLHKKQFHRLQAHVMKKWKGACRYTERLGFYSEALLHKYGPVGEDYILYARVV